MTDFCHFFLTGGQVGGGGRAFDWGEKCPGGVLNFELATNVRPEVLTTTL